MCVMMKGVCRKIIRELRDHSTIAHSHSLAHTSHPLNDSKKGGNDRTWNGTRKGDSRRGLRRKRLDSIAVEGGRNC